MATSKMADQIQFGQWESLPRGSKQRLKMEQDYIKQHHQGGGSLSDFFGDVGGSLGHTLSHPFSSGVHYMPGYGDPLAALATLLTGGAAAPEAAGAAAEGAGAAEVAGEGAAQGSRLGRAAEKVKGAGGKLEGSKVGKAVAAHPIRAAAIPGALAAIGLSRAGHKSAPAVNPGQNALGQAATADPTGASMTGASIMPLFMSSIIQPYMKSILDQIKQTSQGYGDYMSTLIGSSGHPGSVALNPIVQQALSAMIPGQQASMNLLGQSAAGSAVSGSALDQLNAEIQKNIQTQQAAQGAYEKNLLLNQYGSGIPGLSGTGINPLTPAPGLMTNPATNPLVKQIASGGGTIPG